LLGAGLAAPQVHMSRRIVIYGVESNSRYTRRGVGSAHHPGESPFKAFFRWFFADPTTRTISALSAMTQVEYRERMKAGGS
jgi:hypothetical protein